MKRFSNILFVSDRTTDDSAALGQAVALANNNQARLTVAGLVEASAREKAASKPRMQLLLDAIVEQRRDELQSLLRDVNAAGIKIENKVLVGKGFLEIIREVLRHERDLVIKSARGAAKFARSFGTTDMKLLRKCPCPVWLVKANQQGAFRQILVALDYDQEDPRVEVLNVQLLEMAMSLAVSESARLHVIHAWQLPHEDLLRSRHTRIYFTERELDRMVEEEEATRRDWLEALVARHWGFLDRKTADGLKPQLHLPRGHANELVPDVSKKVGADLVVMGSLGRAGIPGLLVGNTAEDILHRIHCSVLTVKPSGFVTPVTLEG